MTSTYPYFETGDVITTKSIDEFTRSIEMHREDIISDPLTVAIKVNLPGNNRPLYIPKSSVGLLGQTFRISGVSRLGGSAAKFLLTDVNGEVYYRLVSLDEIIATVSDSCINNLIRLLTNKPDVHNIEIRLPDENAFQRFKRDYGLTEILTEMDFEKEFEFIPVSPPEPASKDDIDSLYFGDSKE